jgi:hypothetical protein
MSQEKQALPFFARYLQTQPEDMSAEELHEISGGTAKLDDSSTFTSNGDKDTIDGRYPSSIPGNPFDIKIDLPAFSSNFPFLNNSSPTDPGTF